MTPLTAIYTLTSALHDEASVAADTHNFLNSLNIDHPLRLADYSDYGSHALDLIYVRTGGTEGIFRQLLPQLRRQLGRPFFLLTSGKSNSLAASMEILSYLKQNGLEGEIIHGDEGYIRHRLGLLAQVGQARRRLATMRLGIIGEPSDWLISSTTDKQAVKERMGITLQDIGMEELLAEIESTPAEGASAEQAPTDAIRQALPGAERIYRALKSLIGRHHLQGFTLRCFDLLTAVKNTGCLALARLNAEGYVAGCEGDVPAMLSMAMVRSLFGTSGFQANPARINPKTGEMLFAHCTIPLDMVERYELDTHFESGIGVGIRGFMSEGPVTIFKASPELKRHFCAEATLLACQGEAGLCRTQMRIMLDNPADASYFLKSPIGNHHIILPGHHRHLLDELMA